MGLIVQRVPWTRQPPYPVRLDQSNPIARKMLSLKVPAISGANELVGKITTGASIVGAPPNRPTAGGVGLSFPGTSGKYITDPTAAPQLRCSLPRAMGAYFVPRDVATYQHVISARYSTSGRYYVAISATGKADFQWGNASSVNGTTALVLGVPTLLVMSWDGTNTECRGYVNGKKEVTITAANSNANPTSHAVAVLSSTLGNYFLNGEILYHFIAENFTDSEAAMFGNNPWQIFAP